MPQASYMFEAIGTKWTIDTRAPLSRNETAQIAQYIDAFDAAYSRFRSDSLVSKLFATTDAVEFPASITEILGLYTALNKHSGGKINPLVGESLARLGYDASYSLRPSTPLPAPSYTSTLLLRDHAVQLTTPAVLDIGAIGKGYLVDAIATIIGKYHDSFTVDGSGDIVVGSKNWETIGLEHPRDPARVIGIVRLQDASLCASGIGKRAWGNGLHHILNATTGLPADTDILATWAIAPTATLADALATGLFFIEATALQTEFGPFYYMVMHTNGAIEHNIPAEVGEIFA